ncbi:hypothetical protein AVEN_162422-1 [Araneus ventricosus]|uniref:Uncharacterized protein n=1 Tax=Araneus ventricosus TaxID=182803 RepID=A0A4Y2T2Q5_ARAVE|nr:hypothetical protein AVEN_162422-1 [Araneus ventricosus]
MDSRRNVGTHHTTVSFRVCACPDSGNGIRNITPPSPLYNLTLLPTKDVQKIAGAENRRKAKERENKVICPHFVIVAKKTNEGIELSHYHPPLREHIQS